MVHVPLGEYVLTWSGKSRGTYDDAQDWGADGQVC